MRFFPLLAIALVLSVGCSTPGTVGQASTVGLLAPVVARADAYIVVKPDALTAAEGAQYAAAKELIAKLPSDKRVAAAQSWFAVSYICDVHDAFVKADGSLDEVHRSTYIRSTQLLRKVYAEAYKADGKEAPASQPAEGKPFREPVCPECTGDSCGVGK